MKEQTCKHCRQKFYATARGQYCSNKCRQAAYRIRKELRK